MSTPTERDRRAAIAANLDHIGLPSYADAVRRLSICESFPTKNVGGGMSDDKMDPIIKNAINKGEELRRAALEETRKRWIVDGVLEQRVASATAQGSREFQIVEGETVDRFEHIIEVLGTVSGLDLHFPVVKNAWGAPPKIRRMTVSW